MPCMIATKTSTDANPPPLNIPDRTGTHSLGANNASH
jgi:hypothetical protein